MQPVDVRLRRRGNGWRGDQECTPKTNEQGLIASTWRPSQRTAGVIRSHKMKKVLSCHSKRKMVALICTCSAVRSGPCVSQVWRTVGTGRRRRPSRHSACALSCRRRQRTRLPSPSPLVDQVRRRQKQPPPPPPPPLWRRRLCRSSSSCVGIAEWWGSCRSGSSCVGIVERRGNPPATVSVGGGLAGKAPWRRRGF